MEQVRNTHFRCNSIFFIWCLGLPVLAFVITLSIISSFSAGTHAGASVTGQSLHEFLTYYDTHWADEFFKIFINNYCAVLILIYFTPITMGVRSIWEKFRKNEVEVSGFEKILLYLFPILFLIRQAVNIALILNNFSGQIDKNIYLTLAGIIMPHGIPELLVFSLVGALGMEVTRRHLSDPESGGLVRGGALGMMSVLVALCAFIEVYFTPRVFVYLMNLTGVS